jgi:hypothetical protein
MGTTLTNKHIDEIISLLSNNPVIGLKAPPASGKSTLLPEAMIKQDVVVFLTEPTTSAVETLSSYQSKKIGEQKVGYAADRRVSYRNNFLSSLSSIMTKKANKETKNNELANLKYDEKNEKRNTKLVYVTEGHMFNIFTYLYYYYVANKEKNNQLNFCDVLIIDEAHKRTVDIDFIIAMWKYLLSLGCNVPRLLLVSATLYQEVLPFDSLPIYELEFERYPVTISYHNKNFEVGDIETYNEMINVILTKHRENLNILDTTSDIWLAFCPGSHEVEYVCQQIRLKGDKSIYLTPAYADMLQEDKDKIFAPCPKGMRKLIVATNIAEVSMTIPSTSYVFDSMTEKVTYESISGGTKLELVSISQSSAKQRAYRTGRTREGNVYRMCTESYFNELEKNVKPEIDRVPLHNLILTIYDMDIEPLTLFPYLSRKRVDDSLLLLSSLSMLERVKETEYTEKRVEIKETYNDYKRRMIDLEDKGLLDTDWIYALFEKNVDRKKEKMLYKDQSFVVIKDKDWQDEHRRNKMHLLAIVSPEFSIETMRDLRGEDIPLLRNMYNETVKIIKREYNIDENNVRAYFHYPPSANILHIHFKYTQPHYTYTMNNIPLDKVIKNLEGDSDFYKKTVVTYLTGEKPKNEVVRERIATSPMGNFAVKFSLSVQNSALLYRWINMSLPIFPCLSLLCLIDSFSTSYYYYPRDIKEKDKKDYFLSHFSQFEHISDLGVLLKVWIDFISLNTTYNVKYAKIVEYSNSRGLNNRKFSEFISLLKHCINTLKDMKVEIVVGIFNVNTLLNKLQPLLQDIYGDKIFTRVRGNLYQDEKGELYNLSTRTPLSLKDKGDKIIGLITYETDKRKFILLSTPYFPNISSNGRYYNEDETTIVVEETEEEKEKREENERRQRRFRRAKIEGEDTRF